MNEPETSTAEILVHLVYPGAGTRDYHLTEGSTLADLLRLSGVSMAGQAVFVGGLMPEVALPLPDGAVVTVVPRPANPTGEEPWRAAVPSFRDDDLFREYLGVLEDRRREAISEEDSRG